MIWGILRKIFTKTYLVKIYIYYCQHAFHTIDISRGQHLSTMYTHALWSTRARREHLLTTKYFACRCKRCADPIELGTHLGTLNCPCKNGLMLPNDPLNPNTNWSCDACPGTITSAEVAELIDRLEEEVVEVMKQATEYTLSELLSRYNIIPFHLIFPWLSLTLIPIALINKW